MPQTYASVLEAADAAIDLRSAFSLGAPAASTGVETRLLNTRQAAEYLNRSSDFVRRVLRYEVPVVQHGRGGPLYFHRSDLDRWAAQHTQDPSR